MTLCPQVFMVKDAMESVYTLLTWLLSLFEYCFTKYARGQLCHCFTWL